jgi:hypothetical protein
MISRAQLEEQLAQQRARRKSTKRPTPRKGSKLVSVLVVLAILFSSGAAFEYIVRAPASDAITPVVVVTETILPSVSPSKRIPPASVTSPIPAIMQVCTNIPQGRLHVRFAAGEGSDVRGYLAEGEEVQIAIANSTVESQTIQGELWLRLLSPVAGWVNAHYLCEKGSSK